MDNFVGQETIQRRFSQFIEPQAPQKRYLERGDSATSEGSQVSREVAPFDLNECPEFVRQYANMLEEIEDEQFQTPPVKGEVQSPQAPARRRSQLMESGCKTPEEFSLVSSSISQQEMPSAHQNTTRNFTAEKMSQLYQSILRTKIDVSSNLAQQSLLNDQAMASAEESGIITGQHHFSMHLQLPKIAEKDVKNDQNNGVDSYRSARTNGSSVGVSSARQNGKMGDSESKVKKNMLMSNAKISGFNTAKKANPPRKNSKCIDDIFEDDHQDSEIANCEPNCGDFTLAGNSSYSRNKFSFSGRCDTL